MTARKRDPEARRATILDATVGAIAELGLAGVSHRVIASRAGVPLGSTTYYFPSLNDLVGEALRQVTDNYLEELREWGPELQSTDDLPGTLVRMIAHYLEDRRRATLEYELYVAAAREAALQVPARVYLDHLHALLVPRTSPEQATAVSMMLDGACMRALALDEPLDTAALEHGLRAMLQ